MLPARVFQWRLLLITAVARTTVASAELRNDRCLATLPPGNLIEHPAIRTRPCSCIYTSKHISKGVVHPQRSYFRGEVAEPSPHTWEIGTAELLGMMERKDLQLIDVREPEELQETGAIPGAVNVPLGEIEDALQLSPEAFHEQYGALKPAVDDENIVFSCRTGVRSGVALEAAHRLGYSKAKNYTPGWCGWSEYLELLVQSK